MYDPTINTEAFRYRFANRSNLRGFQQRRNETLAEIDFEMSDVDGYARADTHTNVVEFEVPGIALFYFGSVISQACKAHGLDLT